jgi:hypothetical protein
LVSIRREKKAVKSKGSLGRKDREIRFLTIPKLAEAPVSDDRQLFSATLTLFFNFNPQNDARNRITHSCIFFINSTVATRTVSPSSMAGAMI